MIIVLRGGVKKSFLFFNAIHFRVLTKKPPFLQRCSKAESILLHAVVNPDESFAPTAKAGPRVVPYLVRGELLVLKLNPHQGRHYMFPQQKVEINPSLLLSLVFA